MERKEISVEEWTDALWDFMLEHCEIEASGALFVKFHARDRYDIERRIRNRSAKRQAYHREDPRHKEYIHIQMASEHHEDRREARQKWIDDRNKRRRERELAAMPWAKRTMLQIREAIHSRLMRTHGKVVKLRAREDA